MQFIDHEILSVIATQANVAKRAKQLPQLYSHKVIPLVVVFSALAESNS